MAHFIYLCYTFLHNHNIRKSLQVPYSMCYAYGKLCTDIVGTLEGYLLTLSKVRMKQTLMIRSSLMKRP